MKMRSLLYPVLLSVVALFAVQCKNAEKDGPASQPQGKEITIVATLEQPTGTKTSLDAENKVLWQAGDIIKVYNASNLNGVELTLTDGAGTTVGKFSGTSPSGAGPFYAIYPASAGGAFSISDSNIAVTLPQNQTYAAGSFGSGAAVSVAKAETVDKLFFKNVLGGVSMTVTSGGPISGIRIQTKGNEALSGSGTITVGDGVPAISVTKATDEDSYLNVICESAVSTPATFIVMLPPGAFTSGFLVEFLDNNKEVMFRSAKAVADNEVKRSSILFMPESTYTPAYKADFFTSEGFGYYPAIGAGADLNKSLAYEEANSQYAFLTGETREVRVQSLERGFYTIITTPKEMALGESYNVDVTTLVGDTKTALDTKSYKVLQKTADRVWLVNDTDHSGIIQKLED